MFDLLLPIGGYCFTSSPFFLRLLSVLPSFFGRLFFSQHCDSPYLKIKYASQLNHIGIIIVVVRGYHFPRAYF